MLQGSLKAFKRAAESLEKLMDATREELPDTMAAVRLSGMEISDLTMELSDLGLVPFTFDFLKIQKLFRDYHGYVTCILAFAVKG